MLDCGLWPDWQPEHGQLHGPLLIERQPLGQSAVRLDTTCHAECFQILLQPILLFLATASPPSQKLRSYEAQANGWHCWLEELS